LERAVGNIEKLGSCKLEKTRNENEKYEVGRFGPKLESTIEVEKFSIHLEKLLQLKSFRRGSKAPIGVEKLLFGLERSIEIKHIVT